MRADNKIFVGFVVAVITVLAGAIAKVMHWPYGPELLLGGQSLGWTLVIIWYMRKVRQKRQEEIEDAQKETWKRYLNIALGIAAFVIVVGATFKIMHWPYASALLLFGQLFGGLCLIAWFARDKQDNLSEKGE